MCTNQYCLGTYWCSEWGCCKLPEVEMDNSDFEEPPAKKTTPRFAWSPVSPSKWTQFAGVSFHQIPRKPHTGQCAHLSSGEISGMRKAARNAFQICWRSPQQIALTAALCGGNLIRGWKTVPAHWHFKLTGWSLAIATAKNTTVTAQVS